VSASAVTVRAWSVQATTSPGANRTANAKGWMPGVNEVGWPNTVGGVMPLTRTWLPTPTATVTAVPCGFSYPNSARLIDGFATSVVTHSRRGRVASVHVRPSPANPSLQRQAQPSAVSVQSASPSHGSPRALHSSAGVAPQVPVEALHMGPKRLPTQSPSERQGPQVFVETLHTGAPGVQSAAFLVEH
jgi:hypothetical protein